MVLVFLLVCLIDTKPHDMVDIDLNIDKKEIIKFGTNISFVEIGCAKSNNIPRTSFQ